jgi:hypothetical protein
MSRVSQRFVSRRQASEFTDDLAAVTFPCHKFRVRAFADPETGTFERPFPRHCEYLTALLLARGSKSCANALPPRKLPDFPSRFGRRGPENRNG